MLLAEGFYQKISGCFKAVADIERVFVFQGGVSLLMLVSDVY